MRQTTKSLVLCALFAALTAVLSQIAIPLGFTPVPVNLATFAVFLAGGLLGAWRGALSMGVYILLGAVGLPVFSEFSGGVGVIAGPTGGYIIGYLLCAWITGAFYRPSLGTPLWGAVGMMLGLFACYAAGTAWFMLITNSGLVASLAACVFPFLPGDALKIAGAVLLTKKLRKALSL